MLDLGKLTQQFYQIKMIDGEVIDLKKPSENLLRKLFKLQELDETDIKVINTLYDILTEVLNNNVNSKVYKREDIVNQIDVGTASLVLQDYLENTVNVVGE